MLMDISVILFLFFIFVIGSVMGSFVGAMTWRMRHHMDWVRGRSECEHCHHQLAAIDLIPIVSYASLRGKCRYCHKKIGSIAIKLEIGTGLVFLLSAMLFPSAMARQFVSVDNLILHPEFWSSFAFGLWLVILTMLVALFVYDWHWKLLPNKLVFPLIAVSIMYSLVVRIGVWHQPVLTWLIESGLSLLPISGVYLLIYILSGGRLIGFGDVKLGIALGLMTGWQGGILILFLANLMASLYSIPGLAHKKLSRKSHIPFGPFLIAASYFIVLVGWKIIDLLFIVYS